MRPRKSAAAHCPPGCRPKAEAQSQAETIRCKKKEGKRERMQPHFVQM